MKTFALVILTAALLAPAAHADGLPVLGVDVGPEGVTVPGSDSRFVALAAPPGTVVARISLQGGRVLNFRYLARRYTVPAVAYDGSVGGLSAGGRTLVLLTPRVTFPRARTRLRVMDTTTLRTRQTIDLHGDYSFDAISPDGATLFLVHYLSAVDPTYYEVRAYDVIHRRLLADPIVDPAETGEQMRGSPITRTMSSDGRWAYTLYDGAGKPFVHALDTVGRTAHCIDLDGLAGRDLNGARLVLDHGSLSIRLRRRTVAAVPREAERAGFPWTAAALALLVVVGGAGVAVRRRAAA